MKIKAFWTLTGALLLGAYTLACASGAEDDTAAGNGALSSSGSPAPTKKTPPTAASGTAAATTTNREAGAAAPAGLCTAAEQTLFQCSVAGGATIAVCGSKDLSATTGYLQFRMTSNDGKPPAALPDDRVRDQFRSYETAATLMFSGGGGAYIRFGTDDNPFVVYTAIGRGFDESGAAIESGGKLLTAMKCTDDPHSQLGPDLFSAAGLPEGQDSLDFDLPTPN